MANNRIQVKRTSVSGRLPNTTNVANSSYIAAGELALNLTDGILYSSNGSSIIPIGANNVNINVSGNLTVTSVIANGSLGTSNQVLTSNGTGVYWSTPVSGGGGGTAYNSIYLQYTGDGTNTVFSVPGGYAANNIGVYINGALLRNGSDVDVSSGSSITFTEAPPSGSLIDIIGQSTIYANGVSSVVSQQFTANGTANSFTISGGYLPNTAIVFLNGVKQIPGTDVDTTSGNTVNFTVTPANGYVVDVYGYQAAIVQSNSALTVGNTVIGLNQLTVPSANIQANTTTDALRITQIGTGNALYIEDAASDTTPFLIDATGYVVKGGTTVVSDYPGAAGQSIQVQSAGGTVAGFQVAHRHIGAQSGYLSFAKTRGADFSHASGNVISGDYLGRIRFYGDDANTWVLSSAIESQADATPTANSGIIPGRLVFLTSDTSGNLVEALRINSSGRVGIGITSPVDKLQVKGATNQNILLGGSIALANSAAVSAINDAGTANIPMEIRYANNLVFYDGGTEKARIDASGIFSCLLTNSQASNGYTKLPNGVYLQWGTATASTGGVSTSFPIAFPTACWGVIGINTNQPNPPAPSISYSRTGFTATVFAGFPTISWFAVGY